VQQTVCKTVKYKLKPAAEREPLLERTFTLWRRQSRLSRADL
jgi:hypothetical protein